jgi:DNA-binding NarL/FixJ family response regulator
MADTPLIDCPTAPRARLLLAEDHLGMFAHAATALHAECVVVGTVGDGLKLLAAADRLHPDIVVLDITMPRMNGIEAARELRRTHPEIRLVFLTVHDDPDYATAAFETGALGYVVKSRLVPDLLPAVRAALAGQRFLSPSVRLDQEPDVLPFSQIFPPPEPPFQ